MSEMSPQDFVLSKFSEFLQTKNISQKPEELSPDALKKLMNQFNREVPKYFVLGQMVIELNLGNDKGDIDFKTYSLEEFVDKTAKFEEAAEFYISRKDAESRIWVALTAVLLISLVISWLY